MCVCVCARVCVIVCDPTRGRGAAARSPCRANPQDSHPTPTLTARGAQLHPSNSAPGLLSSRSSYSLHLGVSQGENHLAGGCGSGIEANEAVLQNPSERPSPGMSSFRGSSVRTSGGGWRSGSALQ